MAFLERQLEEIEAKYAPLVTLAKAIAGQGHGILCVSQWGEKFGCSCNYLPAIVALAKAGVKIQEVSDGE